MNWRSMNNPLSGICRGFNRKIIVVFPWYLLEFDFILYSSLMLRYWSLHHGGTCVPKLVMGRQWAAVNMKTRRKISSPPGGLWFPVFLWCEAACTSLDRNPVFTAQDGNQFRILDLSWNSLALPLQFNYSQCFGQHSPWINSARKFCHTWNNSISVC